MGISQQCKFELKANVDRVQKEKNISRRQAIALVADEVGLIEETARTMDKRAKAEWVQIEPKKSKHTDNQTKSASYKIEEVAEECEPVEIKENLKNAHGGERKGAGRKLSQNTIWKKVEKKLSELIEFMKPVCETPADIDEEIKSEIKSHINFLNTYKETL